MIPPDGEYIYDGQGLNAPGAQTYVPVRFCAHLYVNAEDGEEAVFGLASSAHHGLTITLDQAELMKLHDMLVTHFMKVNL